MNNIYSEDVGELRGVFSYKITYWHHLNVDWAEIACLKAIILFNLGMHFLAVSKLKGGGKEGSHSVVINL